MTLQELERIQFKTYLLPNSILNYKANPYSQNHSAKMLLTKRNHFLDPLFKIVEII